MPGAAAGDGATRVGKRLVIGSRTGKRPVYGRTPYAASKMALVGLVRTLAVELGPVGMRINLLSPGGVAGPRIETVIREQARATGSSYEAVYEETRNPASKAARSAGGHRLRRPVPGL